MDIFLEVVLGAAFTGAAFTGAAFTGAAFTGAAFTGATFAGAGALLFAGATGAAFAGVAFAFAEEEEEVEVEDDALAGGAAATPQLAAVEELDEPPSPRKRLLAGVQAANLPESALAKKPTSAQFSALLCFCLEEGSFRHCVGLVALSCRLSLALVEPRTGRLCCASWSNIVPALRGESKSFSSPAAFLVLYDAMSPANVAPLKKLGHNAIVFSDSPWALLPVTASLVAEQGLGGSAPAPWVGQKK